MLFVEPGHGGRGAPMNLEMVESFDESRHWDSKLEPYTIVFYFSGATRTWFYQDEESRNKDFERLLDYVRQKAGVDTPHIGSAPD